MQEPRLINSAVWGERTWLGWVGLCLFPRKDDIDEDDINVFHASIGYELYMSCTKQRNDNKNNTDEFLWRLSILELLNNNHEHKMFRI